MRHLVIILAILALSATTALACSCRPPDPKTLAELRAGGAKLLLGRVLARVKTGGANINAGHLVYLVEVEKSVNLPRSHYIAVRTAPNSALCGVNLKVGAMQILRLGGRGQDYGISICSNLFWIRSDRQARRVWRDLKAGGTLPPRR